MIADCPNKLRGRLNSSFLAIQIQFAYLAGQFMWLSAVSSASCIGIHDQFILQYLSARIKHAFQTLKKG
jgi:hypothetical protein